MKISIIGAGGVGGYFGARLAAAGNDINFVVRGQHKSAMDTNGLLVKSIKGDVHIKNVRTFEKISQLPLSDLVLVAVKSWQVRFSSSLLRQKRKLQAELLFQIQQKKNHSMERWSWSEQTKKMNPWRLKWEIKSSTENLPARN